MEQQTIFQVVGFQNSGKTTLLEKLIKKGIEHGVQIGTVKHHGHGGLPTRTNINDKDSDKHRNAGASISAVEGGGELNIEANKTSWTLEEILHIYKSLPVNLVFIEGYKRAPYPKVVMIRHQEDIRLLEELENIKAVITWIPIDQNDAYDIYSINDTDLFIEVFYNIMVEEL